ncbi:hypothetical protein K4H03_20680 [Mycobacterium tuberculosis]|nr:hypothetical protein [Mycobacterium tuberculosis]
MNDPRKCSEGLRRAQRAYIEAILDEILPPLRRAAEAEGYAIAVHGSLARDIDLVAIPWTENARAPDLLVRHIQGILAGIFGACYISEGWTLKPHGRIAKTLHSHTMTAEIDLSVMPRIERAENEAD